MSSLFPLIGYGIWDNKDHFKNKLDKRFIMKDNNKK